MANPSGYVVILSKDRLEKFRETVEYESHFEEPVAEFEHSRNLPLVCFIINDQAITHIASGRRGSRAGTGLRRLNLFNIEELPEPISLTNLVEALLPRNKAHVKNRFRHGGLLAHRSFVAVIEAIRAIETQSIPLIERYSVARSERISRFSPEVKANLAREKEALLTALSIAGMSRDIIQEWVPSEEMPSSFLDGLPNARLREDQMIINDMQKIPGFSFEKMTIAGAAVFHSQTERLTVVHANRLPLEMQTGTDLVYFNETFQSFIMVQYKAMDHEPNNNGVSEAVFRLPGKNLAEEIARMEAMISSFKACVPNSSYNGFRLSENPFFLKLCPRLVFNPDDAGLVPGMYIPLDYWKLLEQSEHLQGARGGRRVTFENVGRYLDNTAFTTFVAKAWIGTTPSQSALLIAIIRETIESGRAVTVAVKSKPEHKETTAQPAPLPTFGEALRSGQSAP